ncbi:MAG: hypothetical protein ACTSRA_19005, partial [Promethearchaeota archaeon]
SKSKFKKEIARLEKEGFKPDDPQDPDSPSLYKRKADFLFNQQKFQDALVEYDKGLKTNKSKDVLRDEDKA